MKCFYCGKEIEKGEFWYIAMDVPYYNMPVHRETCLVQIEKYGVDKYINENMERIRAIISEEAAPTSGKIKIVNKTKRKL